MSKLVFAWSRLDDVPTILGQMNFFQTFKVLLIGAEKTFDIALYSYIGSKNGPAYPLFSAALIACTISSTRR